MTVLNIFKPFSILIKLRSIGSFIKHCAFELFILIAWLLWPKLVHFSFYSGGHPVTFSQQWLKSFQKFSIYRQSPYFLKFHIFCSCIEKRIWKHLFNSFVIINWYSHKEFGRKNDNKAKLDNSMVKEIGWQRKRKQIKLKGLFVGRDDWKVFEDLCDLFVDFSFLH